MDTPLPAHIDHQDRGPAIPSDPTTAHFLGRIAAASEGTREDIRELRRDLTAASNSVRAEIAAVNTDLQSHKSSVKTSINGVRWVLAVIASLIGIYAGLPAVGVRLH